MKAFGKLRIDTIETKWECRERLGDLSFDELRAMMAVFQCGLEDLDERVYAYIAGKSRSK